MAELVDESKPFYLIGVSFGGMIATEMNRHINPKRTILISSVPTPSKLPWYYRLLGRLWIDRLVPASFLTTATPLTYWLFGATDLATILLLKQILKDTDGRFLKWAIRAILTWSHQKEPSNLTRIHGTTDRIVPIEQTNPDYTITGGGHLMVYSRSEEISSLLAHILA